MTWSWRPPTLGRSRMGACETTPATSHNRGARKRPPHQDNPRRRRFLAPDHRPPLSGVKLVRPRLRLAGAALRALQLDPRPRDGTRRQRRGNAATAVPPQPGGRRTKVTGSIQHCLLTTQAPMGAGTELPRTPPDESAVHGMQKVSGSNPPSPMLFLVCPFEEKSQTIGS